MNFVSDIKTKGADKNNLGKTKTGDNHQIPFENSSGKQMSPFVKTQTQAMDSCNCHLGCTRGGDDPIPVTSVMSRQSSQTKPTHDVVMDGKNNPKLFTNVVSNSQSARSREQPKSVLDRKYSDASDATQKRTTSFFTRLSINFLVSPAEYDTGMK